MFDLLKLYRNFPKSSSLPVLYTIKSTLSQSVRFNLVFDKVFLFFFFFVLVSLTPPYSDLRKIMVFHSLYYLMSLGPSCIEFYSDIYLRRRSSVFHSVLYLQMTEFLDSIYWVFLLRKSSPSSCFASILWYFSTYISLSTIGVLPLTHL